MLVAWKYRPRNTIIQRLDPRSRLTFLALLIAAITGTDLWDLRVLLPLFLLSLTLYLLARIDWKDTRRVWTFIIFLVVFIVGINGMLGGRGGPNSVIYDQSPVIFKFPELHIPFTTWVIAPTITVVRSFFAITQITRMLTLAILAIPIPYTIDPSIYGTTFRRMGLPDKFSFTMDLAFRFVPTLGRDFMITMDSQRARGYEMESARGGIISRLRRLAPLIVPVTMQAIVTGEEVIDAMDLRAFGVRQRTWLRQLHLAPRDYIFIGLGIAILIFCIVYRVLNGPDVWVPAWWYNLAK